MPIVRGLNDCLTEQYSRVLFFGKKNFCHDQIILMTQLVPGIRGHTVAAA